jgi:PAS domain S-box-containing protein
MEAGERAARKPSISADEWRQIVDSAVETAIVTIDTEGRVKSWNRGAETILGWSEAEMLGSTLERLFPSGSGKAALGKEMADAVATGRGGGEDGWRVRKDGTLIWAVGEMAPIRNSSDEIVGFTKILRNRSSQRRAEEALAEERRALSILNKAGSALAQQSDLQALVQIVTDAGVELTRAQFGAFFYNVLNDLGESYTLYTLSGAPVEAFSKFPMPRNTGVFAPTFNGEGIVRSDDITQDPRYGHNPPYKGMPEGHLPVRSYLAVPVIARSGEVLGGLFFGHADAGVFTAESERGLVGLAAEAAVAIDNTRLFQALQRELKQRRATEAQLAASEDRLRLATEAAEIGTWDYDPADGTLRWDDKSRALFGLPAEADVSYEGTFLAGLHPEDRDRVDREVQRALRPGGSGDYNVEYRAIGQDGVERWLAASGKAIFQDGQPIRFIGTLIDISASKKLEAELRELNERLEERVSAEVERRGAAEEALRQAQKMEAVGQLTGGIAHDFNNLLTVVTGNISMAQRALDASEVADPRARRSLDNAMKGAERAAALTQRLLAFSRRQPLAPKPLDLDKLVMGMSDLLQRSLGELIKLEIVTSPGLWRIEADPNQLESALLNLALNARDAMPKGGELTMETANVRLDESYASLNAEVPPGQYVMVAVTDTGVGMPKEVIAHAFEPFFTTKEVGKGTGLGLSMIYGFVKQSGGHVKIYSEEGEGTTVKIYLPRLLRDPGIAEEEEAAVTPGFEGSPRQETILVVEDDDDVRAYTVDCLRDLGYRVLEAHDGPSAIRLLERQEEGIELLFTDIVMPGMSGRELADEIRKLQPDVRILYTSGYTRNAIVHHGRLDPGVEMIMKPFTFEALAQKVRDMIDTGRTNSVLIVQLEPTVRSLTAEALASSGFRTEEAATGAEAFGKVRAAQGRYDAVLLDDDLPDRPGEEVARELRALHSDLPILIASQERETELRAQFRDDRCIAVIAKPYKAGGIQEALRSLGISCRGGEA